MPDEDDSQPTSPEPEEPASDEPEPPRGAAGSSGFVLPPSFYKNLFPAAQILSKVVDEGILKALRPAFERNNHLSDSLRRSLLPVINAQRLILPDVAAPALAAQRLQLAQSFAPLISAQQSWAKQFSRTSLGLEKVFASLPKIDLSGFERLVEYWREALPPNWPSDLDTALLQEAVYEHGLPVAWVPRAEVLEEMLAAQGRPARLEVLTTHRDAVMDDCARVLTEATHERLCGQVPLAHAALASLRAGHSEAAQALACVVADTAIRHFLGGDYGRVKDLVKVDLDEVTISEVRRTVALAPVHVFLTTWFPGKGLPAPQALSRHVTIHQADRDHLHADNALVAVMLLCSLLRTFHEMATVSEQQAA